MTERPILFSGPMVRALLAGTKTQTRRVMKPQPLDPQNVRIVGPDNKVHYTRPPESALVAEARATPGYRVLTCAEWLTEQHCPYGQPGDRLWVREAFRILDCWDRDSPAKVGDLCLDAGYPKPWAPTHYEADGHRDNWQSVSTVPGVPTPGKLRPGIHMPRWASRITLEVEAVRVERLQDISDEDSLAEGVYPTRTGLYPGSPRFAYRKLWDDINGPGSWDANPWVRAITFRRITS